MPRTLKSVDERFDEKWVLDPVAGCWLWGACMMRNGYAGFGFRGNTRNAHIFSYERKYGPVPPGLELDHLCRIKRCVNPDHVEPVTRKENLHRSPIWNGNTVSCPAGHLYDIGNTKYFAVGKYQGCRRCRACDRIRHYNKRHPIMTMFPAILKKRESRSNHFRCEEVVL